MRIRLDQLETLYWIARLGSFRAAAQHLHVSQPAISSRIRELEQLTQVQLVDRTRYRPRLTASGNKVLARAEQMLQLARALDQEIDRPTASAWPVRLGVADTFALTHLSSLLMRIDRRYAGTAVELDVDYSANLNRKLHAGEIDLAFLTLPTEGPSVRIEPLVDLELAWVAGPKFVLPARRLTPAELAPVPILTNPRPSHLDRTIREWFAAHGETPRRLNTCTSLSVIAKLVADGFGVAVLPPVILGRELRRGALKTLNTRPPLAPHTMSVGYRLDRPDTNLAGIAALARAVAAGDRVG